MTNDMFSLTDLQKLIDAFPPPEARSGKNCLVRSRSNNNLVRSDVVTKRFMALLDDANHPLPVSNLPGEIGVQDVRWLLEEESLDLFFTRDRQRIIPRPRQREIVDAIRIASQDQGLLLATWAEQYDISVDTLSRMTSRDTDLAFVTLDDGLAYSKTLLHEVQSAILQKVQQSGDTPINITREVKWRLPDTYLEEVTQETISSRHIHGSLHKRIDGLHYIPESALSELQSRKEQAKKNYIDHALRALRTDGYFDVSASRRPESIEGESITHDIQQAYKSLHPSHGVRQLQALSDVQPFLVREDMLNKKEAELAASATQLASSLWEKRIPGHDVSYVQETFVYALAGEHAEATPEAISFGSALVRSQYADAAKSAFEEKIVQLQEFTGKRFAETLRLKLVGPLQLYARGIESISDSTLQPRALDFVADWARRTLAPEVLLEIKNDKLATTKLVSRELDKFTEAVQAAKTLNDISAAAAKLARKQKVDQPDAIVLSEIKASILHEKVNWMKRAKRSSDLLQNLTWVLLASKREGLFMSSGKDTSRMIKLYQADGNPEVGQRLGELRDIIKDGKETDKDKAEMRSMAQAALDSLGARGEAV